MSLEGGREGRERGGETLMFEKILGLIFAFTTQQLLVDPSLIAASDNIETQGRKNNQTARKKHCRLNVRKYSVSQTITD